MTALYLALASTLGWFLSMLAGGGSSLVLMPIIGLFLGAQAVAPVVTVGALLGNSERIYAYWKHIDWQILKWDLPGAAIGAILGAFTLSELHFEWLTIMIAIFLICSSISFLFKSDGPSFEVKIWYFLPGGFLASFLSGLIGSMGPVLAPFYVNYGLRKEELLATQAANRVFIHSIKLIAYCLFGTLQVSHLSYGFVIGLAALPGNWLGALVLDKISEKRFQQFIFAFILFSGFLLLWQQRHFFML